MCNLYTLRLSAWEARNLMQHYKLIGKDWEDVMGARNDALEFYPNRPAPVVVIQDGDRIYLEVSCLGSFATISGLPLND
jgi:hypothetical protein